MKTSTLSSIARQIHNQRGVRETRSVNQMIEDLEQAAGEATSKREAAYLIMTEVFDMIDHEEEDRRKIDDILSQFEGSWTPNREEAA